VQTHPAEQVIHAPTAVRHAKIEFDLDDTHVPQTPHASLNDAASTPKDIGDAKQQLDDIRNTLQKLLEPIPRAGSSEHLGDNEATTELLSKVREKLRTLSSEVAMDGTPLYSMDGPDQEFDIQSEGSSNTGNFSASHAQADESSASRDMRRPSLRTMNPPNPLPSAPLQTQSRKRNALTKAQSAIALNRARQEDFGIPRGVRNLDLEKQQSKCLTFPRSSEAPQSIKIPRQESEHGIENGMEQDGEQEIWTTTTAKRRSFMDYIKALI
jgi:hypothetical protein